MTIDNFSEQIDADEVHEEELDALYPVIRKVLPSRAASTAQDFSIGLGRLIVEAQAGGLSPEDQILVLQVALDALRQAFSR